MSRQVIGRPVTRRALLGGMGAVALGAFTLGACASEPASPGSPASTPRRGGTLTFAANASSATEKLDPQLARGPAGYLRNLSVFDTLTAARSGTWELEPRLAVTWEPSADLRSWTVTLREGVTFHDGSPLTADDVVWTLRRILDESLGSGAYARFSLTMTPDGITAVDARTVSIALKGQDSLLPYAFADPATVIVRNGQGEFTVDRYAGTGPYTLTSFTPGEGMEFARNGAYWDPELPYLDTLRRVDATDEATASQGVLSGGFDVAEAISPAAAAALGDASGAQLVRLPGTTSLVLVMDGTQAPFTDERVREAFKLAIDRDQVLKTVFAGYGAVTEDLPMTPTDPYYPSTLGGLTYDPAKAKSLLAAAGHPDGIDIDLWTYGTYSPLAVAFSESARAAGIRVTVKQGNEDTYWDEIYLVEPFYTTDWQQFFPPDLLWYTFGAGSSANESKLTVPGIGEAYAQALATTEPAGQQARTAQGLELAATDMGLVIPVMSDQLLLAKSHVRGVTSAPFTRYDLRHAWLDT